MTDNNPVRKQQLEPFLAHVRTFPFIEDVVLEDADGSLGNAAPADGILRVRTPTGTYRFFLEVKRTNLGHALVDGLIARVREHPERPWVLFAPHVARAMGERLGQAGVNYVDEVGNCRLELGAEHVALVEGRKKPRPTTGGRTTGAATVEVMFAFLADPELAEAPVREIAERVGVGKTAVAEAIQQLAGRDLISREKPRRILRRKDLFDRWLIGYETIVRPKWIVGRYRTREEDPRELEQRIEQFFTTTNTRWGWTGGAAAMKMTGFYRGEQTVIAMEHVPADFFKRLEALRAQQGNLTVLEIEGDLAYEGARRDTVHPLLVYAELLIAGDERARQAAEEVRHQWLEQLV